MKLLSVLIACLFICSTLLAEETKSVHQIKSLDTTLKGKPFKFEYLLFLPEDYQAKKAQDYPLILFLHGAGARGNDVAKLREHHLPVVFEDKPGFPAIVVSPQCPTRGWWDKEMLDKLDELLKDVTTKYRVDKSRVYLTGLSMGGFGTWNMLRKYPDWFAAFASVCGATGTKPEEMKKLAHLPAWSFHGNKDQVVPMRRTQQAVDAFRKAGGKIEMTVCEGIGHNAWEPAYDGPDLFIWLLGHKKGDPNFKYVMDEKTKTFFEQWRVGLAYAEAREVTPFVLDQGTGKIKLTRKNLSKYPLEETVSWHVENPNWSISPMQKTIKLGPGAETTVNFIVTYKGGRHDLNPVPTCTSELTSKGKLVKRFGDTLTLDDKAFFRKRLLTQDIPKLTNAPKIDADLSDACWQAVPELSPLQQSDGKGPSPVKTQVKIAYDQKNLYMSVIVHEPNPKKLMCNKKKRDNSVYGDDNFAFFIQPDIDKDTYYHTIINPIGTIMDGQAHDRSWNSEIVVKTKVNDDNWCAEFAIPWKSFGMGSPKPGDRIGFEFEACRKQIRAVGQWTPTYGWGHQPSRFGQLIVK